MRLSNFGYYADFFICVALIIVMVGLAIILPTWSMRGLWAMFASFGAVGWTLIEYVVHRWLYHRVPFFRDAHAAHHAEPNTYIGAPPIVAIVLIFAVFFAPLARSDLITASGLTTGVLIGYVVYMLAHHAAHYWPVSPGSLLYQARRRHALHHHHSETVNFGVTTSIWDRVFGTAVTSGRDRAKSRFATS